MLTNPRMVAAAVLVLLTSTASCLAQANYAESFQGVGDGTASAGGPPGLVGRGWTFRNQSRVASSGVSPYWTEFGSVGHAGSSLGHGAFAIWQSGQSKVSAWAILPAIPNQRAGDPIAIWASAWTNSFGMNNATVECRYSPSGGTGTGSGENGTGDFSQVLFTITKNAAAAGWTRFAADLPGSGRIAFRLVLGPRASSFDFTGSFNLDSLQVGNPPPPPYPLPAAGETVRWTTAHSPVQIVNAATGQSPSIAAGGTVIVEPGVEIRFGSGVRFDVEGVLEVRGTGAAPVRMRGPGMLNVRKGGLATVAQADVQSFTDLVNGGRASFTDCAFSDPSLPTGFSYSGPGDVGRRFFDGNLDQARQVVSLERCTFGQGCQVSLVRGWLAARDCTFTFGQNGTTEPGPAGGEAIFVTGNTILKNVTVNGGYIDLMQSHDQFRYLGDLNINGNARGPGIRLEGGGNYFIDPSVRLAGHRYPVTLGFSSAGILPGSRLPASGNEFNLIPDTDDPAPLDEKVVWADAGIPYLVHNWVGGFHGQVTVLPGVNIKALPDTPFAFDTDSNGFAMPVFLGEPERPIRFEPYTPGTVWTGVAIGNVRWFGTRWDWCVFEGSRYGAGAAELPIAFDNCVFRNNLRGLGGSSAVALRKCTFENNVYSYNPERFAPNHTVDGFLDANHPTNPNTFINNHGDPGEEYQFSFLPQGGLIARSRHNSLEDTDSDARNNWWGTPTGPFHPEHNPTGTGDAVFFGIDAGGYLTPFLTEAPTGNPPPVVRMVTQPQGSIIPGERTIVQWTARDDGRIVSQRVYYSARGNFDEYMQLLAEIPATVRSYEWTAPVVGTDPSNVEQYFRVVAVDDLGQEGLADLPMVVTNPAAIPGVLTPSPAIGGVFVPGGGADVCFTVTQFSAPVNAAVELENDETGFSLGGLYPGAGVTCLPLGLRIPDVSTDRARVRYDLVGTLNQVKSFYGPYFTIRPDAILGDAAPTVALTSVHTGGAYAGGTVVPIAWTASDDEALRGFDVRASFDGGVRWFIVARDLPGTARAYDWRLPTSVGIADVRVRVVAKDLRFQNTSAESGPFAITAGVYTDPAACAADINGDGATGVQDVFDFLAAYFAGAPSADFNRTGGVTTQDIFDFLGAYFAGC